MMKTKIAFCPLGLLGDGAIAMIIAQNLASIGYDVTCFHNAYESCAKWVPDFKISSWPKEGEFEKTFSEYDLVLLDGYFRDTLPQNQRNYFDENAIYICDTNRILRSIPKENLDSVKQKIEKSSLQNELEPLLKFADLSSKSFGKTISALEGRYRMCQHVFGQEAKRDINLHPSEHLKKHRYKNRVIIHPTSSLEEKNWSWRSFLKLANRLKANGFDVVFSLAPNERALWEKRLKGQFDMPLFNTICELMNYLYESSYLIGNDSGTGHLASLLGLKTITICHTRSGEPVRWRPDFVKGIVIQPPFRLRIKGKYYWRRLISVKKVLNAFLNIAA